MKLNQLLDKFFKFVEITLVAFLALIIVLVTIQVCSRYIFDNPTTWSEEMTRYVFIWLSMIGAWLALQKGKHLNFDLFVSYLPTKSKDIYNLLSSIVINIYLCVLLISSAGVMPVVTPQTSTTLGFSMAFTYGAIPVAVVLMILSETAKIVITVRKLAGLVKSDSCK